MTSLRFTVDHDHTYNDDEQLIGWVTASCGTRPGDFRVRVLGGATPRTINLPARKGYLAADGHMYEDETLAEPFRLTANDPAFNLRELTYRFDFDLTTLLGVPVQVPSCYGPAPSTDTTLYLTKLMNDVDQPVVEVRTKGYAADILDAGSGGVAVVQAASIEDARDTLVVPSDFDERLDDTRTPTDGSVTLDSFDDDLFVAVGNLGSNYYAVEHHTDGEERFYGMQLLAGASTNVLNLGGGSASGNAATEIRFYTAPDNTELAGLLRTFIDKDGNLKQLGDLFVGTAGGSDRVFYLNAAAGHARSFQFLTGGLSRWSLIATSAAESSGDVGSNLQIQSRHDDGTLKTIVLEINRSTDAITLLGKLTTLAPTTGGSGFVLPHGTAPTSPVDGALWSTTAGLFGRINGTTFQYATLTGAETFTNKTLTTPKIGTSLLDTNGLTILAFTPTASAVNYVEIDNAATNNPPQVRALGSDSNIALMLRPKGSQTVQIYAATGQTPTLEAVGADSNHDLSLKGKGSGVVLTPATSATRASIRLPHGTAPSSPVDGDMWTTSAGLFVRINGVTKTVTLT